VSNSARILLIADTHLGPGQGHRLLDRIEDHRNSVDLIVHAGDIVDRSVLDALADRAATAELVAVKGNNDTGLDLPDRVEAHVAGCRIGVVHDSGPAAGRSRRLRALFPSCDLVVFGHSHLPWHETDVDAGGHAQHHVNPGSAMLRRRAPTCSIARVTVRDGAVAEVRHIAVSREGAPRAAR
jgi:putative phosphoesterase